MLPFSAPLPMTTYARAGALLLASIVALAGCAPLPGAPAEEGVSVTTSPPAAEVKAKPVNPGTPVAPAAYG